MTLNNDPFLDEYNVFPLDVALGSLRAAMALVHHAVGVAGNITSDRELGVLLDCLNDEVDLTVSNARSELTSLLCRPGASA